MSQFLNSIFGTGEAVNFLVIAACLAFVGAVDAGTIPFLN